MKTLATALIALTLAFAADAYPRFVPGQTIHGQVGGPVPSVQEPFSMAAAGKLRIKLVDAAKSLHASFTIRTDAGGLVKQWTVTPGKKFNRKVKIPAAGDYTLTIQSLNGQLAYFELRTDAKLPKTTEAVDDAQNGTVSVSFLAVKGERVRVDFLPLNNDMSSLGGTVLGPELKRPSGAVISSFAYEIEPNYGYSILDAEIDETGVWTVTYSNFPNATDRVKLVVRKVTDPIDSLY